MPPAHFSYAALQRKLSLRGDLLVMSDAPDFVVAIQGTRLDCLALEAKGLVLLSPMRLEQLKTVLGRFPPPVHCTDSRLKHTPSLFEKEAYLLIQELWSVG